MLMQMSIRLDTVPGVQKMYLALTLNSEAVTTLMLGILCFPVFRTYTIHLILY